MFKLNFHLTKAALLYAKKKLPVQKKKSSRKVSLPIGPIFQAWFSGKKLKFLKVVFGCGRMESFSEHASKFRPAYT